MATPAQIRASVGLAPDPASDAIWEQRLRDGEADEAEVYSRLMGRAIAEGVAPDLERFAGTGDADARRDNPTFRQPSTSAPQEPTGPTAEDRAIARQSAPTWLTGKLRDIFTEAWLTNGRSYQGALEAVRNSGATYDNVFFGNRREDGSLRYEENQWLATRDAFQETAVEFGVGQLDRQAMEQLFRQDVSAQEFVQGVGGAYQTFAEPGTGVPQNLMSEFLRGFTSSGSAIAALEQTRASSAYDKVFRGNRREDGSLVFDEQEWYAYKRGFYRTLASRGLDPEFFDHQRGLLVGSIENERSIAEIEDNIELVQDEVAAQIQEVQDFYLTNYGIPAPEGTREAILGSALDPSIRRDMLERRVTASQIGGQAKARGFLRSVDRAEELARAGVTHDAARSGYATAERQLPALSAMTQRFFRGTTDIGQFEEAAFLQDADQQNRLTRAGQEEQSSFSRRDDVRRGRDGLGLAGLQRRG